jgi:thioredoxin 1
MKNSILIFFLFFIACTTTKVNHSKSNEKNLPIETEEVNSNYLVFEKSTLLKDALEKAEKENKPVFLHFSAQWCLPCREMEKNVFTDSEVALFYNKNFINVKAMDEDQNGKFLQEIFSVKGFPTLLYIDKNGVEKDRVIGGLGIEKMLKLGKKNIH